MEHRPLSTFSRRELLRRGVAVASIGVTPSLLAACGGDEEEVAPTGTAAQTGVPQAPPASGRLDFFSWEGYDFPDDGVPSMKKWKAENDVTVKSTYIGNHDDIQAKIRGGGGEGIDLVTYYQGYKPLYQQLEVITPLDPMKLPNLENLFPFFASDEGNFWVDPDGTRTGVPMFWGSLGLTYDSAEITEAPSSYDILFEPDNKGRVAVIDDPVGVYTHGGHILGYDAGQMTEDQFNEISDWLRRLAAQTKGISPSFGDATTRLVSGDAVLAFPGWAAVNQFAVDAGKDTIETTLPEEGGYSFCDAYAIPPTADNVDTAHALINQGLDPRVNAEAANYLVGGTTCAPSVEFLNAGIAELYAYDQLEALLERAPFYNNPPVESDEFVTIDKVFSGWQDVKASA
jgi:spermidine/putrescine transport system substrate-binding protein